MMIRLTVPPLNAWLKRTACLLIAWVPAVAVENSVYDLNDCMRLALEKNRSLQSADHSVQASDWALKETRASGLPQVTLRGSGQYAPSGPSAGYDPALTNSGQLGLQAVAEQTIYDGGRKSFALRQARIALARSRQERRLTKAETRFAVESDYAEILRAQEEEKIREAGLRRLEEYLDLVRTLAASGRAGSSDILKTRLRVAEAQRSFADAEAARREAKYSLGLLMGLGVDTGFSVSGRLDSLGPAPDSALGESPEVAAATLDAQARELDWRLAQSQRLPVLSAIADAGLLTSVENLEQPRSGRSPYWGASLGFNLELPLWSWGALNARAEQGHIAVVNARLRLEQTRDNSRTERAVLLMKLEAAEQRRLALEADIKVAQDYYLLTRSRFAGGDGLATDVLEANTLWMENQSASLRALAEIRTLHANLRIWATH